MNALYLPILFFICHFVGDFWLQTDWMAMNKGKKTLNCLVHVLIYTSCFTVLTLSWKALLFIGVTHFILDRFHIILKKLIYWKNHFPTFDYPPFEYCDTTGYYDDSPYNSATKYEGNNKIIMDTFVKKTWGQPRLFFVTPWLYIISDNVLHLICNFIAIAFIAHL